jgi:DNA polymerase I-like protein with 3'-5' exonuclease and polymerase domains
MSCADQKGYTGIAKGITTLENADTVIGHNTLCFDNPSLDKVWGRNLNLDGSSWDTLTVSRLIFAHLRELDWRRRPKGLPFNLYGSHSLKAWGIRLGCYKGDYKGGWDRWSPEMQRYCEQDVEVTERLYNRLHEEGIEGWKQAIDIEHKFQCIIKRQEKLGVPFDVTAAEELRDEIVPKMEALKFKIRRSIPHIVQETTFIPKRDNKTMGYKKGIPFIKRKEIPFNPGSRQHIQHLLSTKYGWTPTEFTEKKAPKIGREQLEPLREWEEVPDIIDYLDMVKLSGQLYKGKNAWLNLVKEGRIHGGVITNGAVTGRCTHNRPNLAQVPSTRSFKGRESRSLFKAPEGYRMVGADASGLELRMLGHYLFPYDEGKFAREVIEGDIHTANQEAAGLSTRDDAKTFIYAFNYGAGDAKLGSIVEPKASEQRQRVVGSQLRQRFFAKVPAIKQLLEAVQRTFKRRGYLIGLDGRKLFPRSAHSALNTLLQGAGAVVMKQATIQMFNHFFDIKLDTKPALHIHDEVQVICPEGDAEAAGELMVTGIIQAGEILNLNVALDGEYKIGQNWAETH